MVSEFCSRQKVIVLLKRERAFLVTCHYNKLSNKYISEEQISNLGRKSLKNSSRIKLQFVSNHRVIRANQNYVPHLKKPLIICNIFCHSKQCCYASFSTTRRRYYLNNLHTISKKKLLKRERYIAYYEKSSFSTPFKAYFMKMISTFHYLPVLQDALNPS